MPMRRVLPVLAASGLVAGEALTGLAVAGAAAAWPELRERAPLLAGGAGAVATLATAALVCGFLWLAARRR